MAALRSIWKGHLRFSLVTIPIRVYNAVDTAESISFNQIHRECNGRIGYDKRCKKCNNQVENDDIVKGFQYEPDQYVIFEKDDLDKLKLKSTKVIDIEGFVDASRDRRDAVRCPLLRRTRRRRGARDRTRSSPPRCARAGSWVWARWCCATARTS